MEDFNDINFNLDFGNFNPEDVQTDETINAVFIIDVSGSVTSYVHELNAAFNDFVQTMQKSHVADRLFVSIVEFDDHVKVKNGFQPISAIPVMDFSKSIGGTTALYDAVLVGLKNAIDYRTNLENSGVETKTLIFVITDGGDNSSKNPAHLVKLELDKLKKEERSTFSFTSVLFGIGADADFEKARTDMGIEHLAKIGNTGKDIRKMIGFISQSISSASKGQGMPPITF